MLRLLNRKIFISPVNMLLCGLFISCGFIDLRPIHYSIEPHGFDSILNDAYTPLIVKFDTEMEKNDTEGILLVSSDYGAVKGDCRWQGNDLYFVPVSGWTAGIKYTLTLNGTVRSADKRELRVLDYASFYAISKDFPPAIDSHFPADGEAIGINNFALILHFTNPMNRLSVESALSIEGIGNKTFEWLNNDKTIKVIPDKPLSAWTSYKWTLKDSARNATGIPLAKQYSGSFTTNLDQTLPEVVNVYPAVFMHGSWNVTGEPIETGLALNEGIIVEFSKNMSDNVLRSIRFEPSIQGRAEMLAENKIVYVITRSPEPEVKHTMIISADARDAEGLKLGNEYRISFLPNIPYLKVISFKSGSGDDSAEENISSGSVISVQADRATGRAVFSIRFSLLFNNEEKLLNTHKITLSPFFPGSLSSVSLNDVKWASDDRIIMYWEGLKPGALSDSAEKNYYILKIPGGKGGINAGGLYMKEDFTVYLEAVNEK